MSCGARFLALLALSVCLVAADLPAVPPEVAALAAAHGRSAALAGTFRWFTVPAEGGEPRQRQGTFTVARPATTAALRYTITSTAPDGSDVQRWCCDGVGRWRIEQAVPEEPPVVYAHAAGEGDIDLDRVVACVLLDLNVLAVDFTMVVEPLEDGRRRLALTPATPAVREGLNALAVVFRGDDPVEVAIEDARGSRIRLVIDKLVRDPPLKPELFTPPR